MMEKTGTFILRHLEAAAACLAVIALITATRVWNLSIVAGPSMEPLFFSGDLLLTTKDAPPESLRRGRVVVAEIEVNERETIPVIKRVVGIPGDSIRVFCGFLYVNGEKMEETGGIRDAGIAENEVRLGPGEYFLLGDNVNASSDSRVFGPVRQEDITAVFIRKIP